MWLLHFAVLFLAKYQCSYLTWNLSKRRRNLSPRPPHFFVIFLKYLNFEPWIILTVLFLFLRCGYWHRKKLVAMVVTKRLLPPTGGTPSYRLTIDTDWSGVTGPVRRGYCHRPVSRPATNYCHWIHTCLYPRFFNGNLPMAQERDAASFQGYPSLQWVLQEPRQARG